MFSQHGSVKLTQHNQIMLIISASFLLMLVPGHALERHRKSLTRRIPRAVCVLKRSLPQQTHGASLHTRPMPMWKYFCVRHVKCWKGLGNTRVKKVPLKCREAAQVGEKAGQKPPNNKILM